MDTFVEIADNFVQQIVTFGERVQGATDIAAVSMDT